MLPRPHFPPRLAVSTVVWAAWLAVLSPAALSAQRAQAHPDPAPTVAQAQDAVAAPRAVDGEDELGRLTLEELMEELGVPGVSVAVVHDFEIHWARGYGVADVETGRRVDVETLFQAASISKPVAAMAVMRAVQDGLFTLDDDVNDLLTSWHLDGEGFTARRPVTPRTLTSHTSGLGDAFGFPGYEPGVPLPTTVQILEGHERSNVGPIFMEREPMTLYEYSGGGVTLMELALSDVRGRPFHEIMDDDVLGPVGMTRSTYRQPLPPSMEVNAARAHDGEGRSMGPRWHVYPEHAAAGLWTTPSDLARFVIEVQRAARGEEGRVLDRTHVQEMLSPVGVGPYAVGFSLEHRGEGWYFAHGGSNWGFRARLVGHKAKGYGAVVMTNANRGSALVGEIMRRIEEAYRWDALSEGVGRSGERTVDDATRMAEAAAAVLAALSGPQRERAALPFDAMERERFHYLPPESVPRPGVHLGELEGGQRERVRALLAEGLSQEGHLTVRQIMELEAVLQALEGEGRRARRDPDEYYLTVFGEPVAGATWGWKFEGHHLSLNYTVVDGDVAAFAPVFAGANPARVQEGPQEGRRPLGDREDAARALVQALDAERRAQAIIATEAPEDLVTGAESAVDPLSPTGLAAGDMSDGQRTLLFDLVEVYLSMMPEDVAARRGQAIQRAGLDGITFAWAGGLEAGEPHYYRIQGPTFLIEYDNVQNGANHVHSVWRDFDGDFGRDLLREHRARDHGGAPDPGPSADPGAPDPGAPDPVASPGPGDPAHSGASEDHPTYLPGV